MGARGPWAFAAALIFGAAVAVSGQERISVPSPIVTLDQERLFEESRIAERITAETERRTAELAAENRRIEVQLVSEELDLTERRATLTPEAFRAEADAFDAKVQGIREAQDAKARDLQRFQEQERQEFLRRITPVLAEIVRERGAVVVLDRRSVLLSADVIDITGEAIVRINEAMDELSETPAPEPTTDTEPGADEAPAIVPDQN